MGKCKKSKNRSEIPYVQRMQMERAEQMAWHRNDAARIAMQIACVALNNTEGLGYTRLVRFAQETDKLIQEYYSDIVMGEAHLQRRLEQLGFKIQDGRMMAATDAEGEPVSVKKMGGTAWTKWMRSSSACGTWR